MNMLGIARRLSRSTVRTGLSFFLSQGCAACDRPQHQPFCPDCQGQIQDLISHYDGWAPEPKHPLLIGAFGPYVGPIKQALRALKYDYRPEVGRALGTALGEQWLRQQPLTGLEESLANFATDSAYDMPPDSLPMYVLPIPLHHHRQAQRGYNQAEIIARSFSRISGLPLLADGLTRIEDTLPQYQLGLQARQENLKDVFRVGQSLCRVGQRLGAMPRVLLVDDIYTTGTTAKSAANVLARSHVPVVGVIAVARAVSD